MVVMEPQRDPKIRPAASSAAASETKKSRWERFIGHFWSWGALLLALVLAAAGTTGIGLALKLSSGAAAGLMAVSIVVVLLGFSLNVANQVRNKRQAKLDEQRRTKHLTRFNDELSSVLQVVVELLESKQDEESSARFFASAIREARHLFSYDGVRICVYKLDAAERDERDERDTNQPELVFLHLEAFGGRGDHPRAEFRQDNAHGSEVIATALGNIAVPISNHKTSTRTIDRPEHAVWQSTLLVPLKDGTDALGILMIDTRDRVDFSPEDLSVGWTIATLVALGMGALAGGSDDLRPEVRLIEDLFG